MLLLLLPPLPLLPQLQSVWAPPLLPRRLLPPAAPRGLHTPCSKAELGRWLLLSWAPLSIFPGNVAVNKVNLLQVSITRAIFPLLSGPPGLPGQL